ncbi:MAG: hypothetical protein AABY83_05650 [Pseudomonadota bacterium]
MHKEALITGVTGQVGAYVTNSIKVTMCMVLRTAPPLLLPIINIFSKNYGMTQRSATGGRG